MTQAEIQLNDPQTLYRRWEDSQWSPFEIDLDRDKEQWDQLAQEDRDLIYWVLAQLMVAEERITTKFSGLVGAYGSEEEATFLSTQALVEAHEHLVAAPRDLTVKVRFVTIYHLILESTLGLTTFRFATEYLNREDLLPGFVAGYTHIHHDETRHIGYGVWFLRESVRDSPDAAEAVRQTLRNLLPAVAEALGGTGNGSGPDIERLGVSTDEVREFALGGLTRRLDIIGVPLGSL